MELLTEGCMTVADAARQLGVSKVRVHQLITERLGRHNVARVGSVLVLTPDQLELISRRQRARRKTKKKVPA